MNQAKPSWRRFTGAAVSFLILAAILELFFTYRRHAASLHAPHLRPAFHDLPYYAFASFYRMLAAYAFALIFSLLYGMTAAKGPAYERVMIPAIDVAQSVPVVGFFPAAIYFFVSLTHGGRLGVELAAIFLIFTSQAWNMALGVFEAVKTIPSDSLEALEVFGVTGWLKLKRLLLPACVPKLVYNSILSWVSGWYFLIACEIIAVGPARYRLPGIGSFLMDAADQDRSGQLVAGLIVLLAIIVVMDALVWQPLSLWSEKFRYEFAASPGPMRAAPMVSFLASLLPPELRFPHALVAPARSLLNRLSQAFPAQRLTKQPVFLQLAKVGTRVLVLCLLGLFVYAVAEGTVALVRALRQPWPSDSRLIPLATGASAARLFVAYLLSLAWTLPCALRASESASFNRGLAQAAEIVGAVPATALFPVIVLFVIRTTGSMNLASILLIMTGMQWYVLFNLLAGVNQIPEDLKEATRSFGLSRLATWKKLVIPALTPSLITGSITAWGGGWNALILSEFFVFRGRTYQTVGLGALLDNATYQTGNNVMIILSLLSMVLVVIGLNRLIWRKLYNLAAERFRLDY
jgi:NitT/TauT family transport system permease protein